jgi:hypothetical protein
MNPIPKCCDTPEKVEEWKAKWAAYNKAYYQTPKRKAYQKARNQTPEAKAYNKAYRQTSGGKARNKAHQQNLRNEQFTANAFRMMQAASELAKALTNLSEPTPQNK